MSDELVDRLTAIYSKAKAVGVNLDSIREAAAELDKAEREIARLREALEPFAALASQIDALRHGDNSTCEHRLAAKDIRAARAALEGDGT